MEFPKTITEQEYYAIWEHVESFMQTVGDENVGIFISSFLDPRKPKEWNAEKAADVVKVFKEALVAQVIDVESCILAMEDENEAQNEGGTNETGSK